MSKYCKPLAKCKVEEFWQGELDLELQSIDEQLEKIAKQYEQVQLLQTILGMRRRSAEVMIAILDDPNRFQNAQQVSAYAGLIPDQLDI